jgi:hypothetical protein
VTIGGFAKDAFGGENPHGSVERAAVTARLPRQIVHTSLSGGEAICNVEFCSNVQCLGDDEAEAKSHELLRGAEHDFAYLKYELTVKRE